MQKLIDGQECYWKCAITKQKQTNVPMIKICHS